MYTNLKSLLDNVKDNLFEESIPDTFSNVIKGFDWENGIEYKQIIEKYMDTGFQASNFGLAVKEINKMLDCRDQEAPQRHPEIQKELQMLDGNLRVDKNCTIFLGYTSNMISSGLRETIRFLVKNSLVI